MFPPQSTPSKRPKRRVESYRIYKRPYSACSQSSRPSPSSYEKATHGRLVGPTLSTPRGDKYYNQYRPLCEVCPRDRGKVVGTLQGRRDGILKPTNTFVLTFNTPILPTVVKIGFIQVKVDVYIPNPLRCYNCQVFGHHENKCGRHPVCCNCAQPEHCASGQCDKPAKCVNCSGDHPANSKECPQWEKEKQILKIKCEQNISFPEARKQFEQFNGAKTYASAVKPGTCNKSTQTDNKSTQTDDSFTEYLQQQTNKQTKTKEGTQGKSNPSPHPGKSNSSPGPALKAGTLEMIKKDEEKKRKEEKDKLKKQQKEERKQIFLKEQAQKEKELTEKAKQAEKNPYSVFAEKDGEEVMDDESVVFTEPSSSDHLPKGTLSRLPLT